MQVATDEKIMENNDCCCHFAWRITDSENHNKREAHDIVKGAQAMKQHCTNLEVKEYLHIH